MKWLKSVVACVFLLGTTFSNYHTFGSTLGEYNGLRVKILPRQTPSLMSRNVKRFTPNTKQQQSSYVWSIPRDNGTTCNTDTDILNQTQYQPLNCNYGDLEYGYKHVGDIVLLHQIFVNQNFIAQPQDIQLYACLPSYRKINYVKVSNLERQKAYTQRIDIIRNEFQAIVRIPPLCKPRLLIEVYGC